MEHTLWWGRGLVFAFFSLLLLRLSLSSIAAPSFGCLFPCVVFFPRLVCCPLVRFPLRCVF